MTFTSVNRAWPSRRYKLQLGKKQQQQQQHCTEENFASHRSRSSPCFSKNLSLSVEPNETSVTFCFSCPCYEYHLFSEFVWSILWAPSLPFCSEISHEGPLYKLQVFQICCIITDYFNDHTFCTNVSSTAIFRIRRYYELANQTSMSGGCDRNAIQL